MRCACVDCCSITGLTRQQVAHALWELATAGIAAADGFDQLRALMDPRRKAAAAQTDTKRAVRTTAGRWSLLNEDAEVAVAARTSVAGDQAAAIARARRADAAIESFARVLLARYGVLFRDLLARESNAPKWRDLLGILRRLEARGEVRGGRFVSGFGGEQFALPEAADSLRASRNRESQEVVAVSAADPMNLVGIAIPGERVAAVPGKEVRYRNGSPAVEGLPEGGEADGATAAAAMPFARPRRLTGPVLPATPPEPTRPEATLF
jgi:ATP-dependent Lhr-like helicase